ncbi:MAG: hypothetical protein ACRC62_27965 [Microcoleus sp.]
MVLHPFANVSYGGSDVAIATLHIDRKQVHKTLELVASLTTRLLEKGDDIDRESFPVANSVDLTHQSNH